ncbi:MAG: Na(+)/H(+) antiporter subunit D [Verrucomicrobiales bacterium]|nr:Na(+)/H(+) antiporter subunit D [Verrucomicrobiales bacterium]
MTELPPSLLLFAGALITMLLRGRARNIFLVALPVYAFWHISQLSFGEGPKLDFLPTFDALEPLRVDKLSKAFGYIFTLNAAVAFLFAFYVKKAFQHVWALIYIGAALGVIFSGDLITLYVYWEVMAISSAFVIIARNTLRAKQAAFRYVMVHIFGGLLLLAGIVMTVSSSGSIAFDAFDYADANLGTWLILSGFLVNAAAPLFSAWLSDAYPEASVTGGLILSAYTTKTAVYTLLRGFPGWEPLMVIGCVMAVFGIMYALLENDMRRILAYSIINQVGFMVCAAGIGTKMAIAGAVAHAFCHIIYKSLLWMSAGAVLYRTGKSRCTELGGLYKTMPWTLLFGGIGALAISAVPLTSGFTSKTIIIAATEYKELFWVWLILELASAGVFLHAGIKFPYFVFFNKDRGMRPKEAPKTMLWAMGILSFLCIYLGVRPQALYDILPYPVDYQAYTVSHLVTQMQLLMFSALVFFLFLPMLKRTATISLDTDWFYRKGGQAFYRVMDKSLNGINTAVADLIAVRYTAWLGRFFRTAPAEILGGLLVPYWMVLGLGSYAIAERKEKLILRAKRGAFPIGITACLAVMMLAIIYLVALA